MTFVDRPAASMYAAVKSVFAVAGVGSGGVKIVPFTIPGGKPTTALPGLTPRSPLIIVGPTLVTVEPARAAKFAAEPRLTGGWPAVTAPVVKVHGFGTAPLASGLAAKS